MTPEIHADIGDLLDALAVLGYRPVASDYSPETFGNWLVDLEGPRAVRLCKDRGQFMVRGDHPGLAQAGLTRAFRSRDEFARSVLSWITGSPGGCESTGQSRPIPMGHKPVVLVTERDGCHFEIQEVPGHGFYVLRFPDTSNRSSHDFLQDDVVMAMQCAKEEWGIPESAWAPVSPATPARIVMKG